MHTRKYQCVRVCASAIACNGSAWLSLCVLVCARAHARVCAPTRVESREYVHMDKRVVCVLACARVRVQ